MDKSYAYCPEDLEEYQEEAYQPFIEYPLLEEYPPMMANPVSEAP